MFKKLNRLLLVSRAKFVKKSETTYFNIGDGFYIDEISYFFKETTILADEISPENIISEIYSFKNNSIKCIDRKPFSNRKILFKIIELIKLINKHDVIFLFYPVQFSLLVGLVGFLLRKSIIAYNGGVWSEAKTLKTKEGYKKNFKIIYFNFLENLSIFFSNYYLVNNNTLYKKYNNKDKVLKAIPLLRIKKEDIYLDRNIIFNSKIKILNVNHVKPGKGIFELIRGIDLFRKENKIEVKLTIVGDIKKEKDYYNELKNLISKLNLKNHVLFTGNINNYNAIIELYRSSDIFILPSISEGFPRVIWESFSQSLPVICTAIPNIVYEFDENKMPVFLINDNTPENIKNGLIEMVSNVDMREEIIANGLFYLKNKMLTTTKNQLEDIFKNF